MGLRTLVALRALATIIATTLALSACAGLPPPQARTPTQSFQRPEATALGQLARAASPNPSFSGFRLVIAGDDAFGSLVALADHAQRSLDLQYYLITNEASTRTLLRRVHAAAERGVRVRLLMDDLNTAGEDEGLLCLTRHPNIEVRLYNPLPSGRLSTATRVLASLTDIDRINQRMHNKMLVADNALAITGGRNLGDAYFVQSPTTNFVDLDLLVAGPAVRQLSKSFDSFWNGPLAYQVTEIVKKEPRCSGPLSPEPAPSGPRDAGERSAAAATGVALRPVATGAVERMPPPAAAESDSIPVPASALARDLAERRLRLVWAPAAVLADKPSKIASEGAPADSETIADDVMALMRTARSELVVVSPYFVPGPPLMDLFRQLRARGVRVKVLTNSLAATDAPVVHIGYARYRKPLLEMGVELHELRRDAGPQRSGLIGSRGSSEASLHAKAMVVDRRTLLVGSMNMDPRSAQLNTEIGLVLRSPVVSEQLLRVYEEVARAGAYRLELLEGGKLRWASDAPDVASHEGGEPGAGVGLRVLLLLLTPFAPDEML